LVHSKHTIKYEIKNDDKVNEILIETPPLSLKSYDHPFERTVVDLYTLTKIAAIKTDSLVIDLGSKIEKTVNSLPVGF
jgi:hypothetical protein